jgi:hypothetical protein
MVLFVTISSGSFSSKSTGVAVWNTPMHPSIAALKLSGLQRSALKIFSFCVAFGRFVRKLTSLFWPAVYIILVTYVSILLHDEENNNSKNKQK